MFSTFVLAATSKSNGSAAIVQLLFFAVIGLGMYFVLIRPQRRRMRESQQMLAKIVEGDEVITTGGIYGFINAVDGDVMWLDIAEGVEIRVHRSAIARKIDPAKEPAGGMVKDAPAAESIDTDTVDDDDEQ